MAERAARSRKRARRAEGDEAEDRAHDGAEPAPAKYERDDIDLAPAGLGIVVACFAACGALAVARDVPSGKWFHVTIITALICAVPGFKISVIFLPNALKNRTKAITWGIVSSLVFALLLYAPGIAMEICGSECKNAARANDHGKDGSRSSP
jgi:hypothetical protein